MGIYQRENRIFYLQVRENSRYKRVSLETKNKYIAQELYNAYLLDKVKSKLYKSQYIKAHQFTQETQKTLIKNIYQKYIIQCTIQNFTRSTINGKENLLKIFQNHRIHYICHAKYGLREKISKTNKA